MFLLNQAINSGTKPEKKPAKKQEYKVQHHTWYCTIIVLYCTVLCRWCGASRCRSWSPAPPTAPTGSRRCAGGLTGSAISSPTPTPTTRTATRRRRRKSFDLNNYWCSLLYFVKVFTLFIIYLLFILFIISLQLKICVFYYFITIKRHPRFWRMVLCCLPLVRASERHCLVCVWTNQVGCRFYNTVT